MCFATIMMKSFKENNMRDLVSKVYDNFLPLRRASCLFDELENMFDDFARGVGFSRLEDIRPASFVPAVDVVQKDGQVEVSVEVPGIKKEDISITLQDGLLIVSGEKKQKHEDEQDGCYKSEISYGSFHREFNLPSNTKLDEIVANYEEGTLKIILPTPVKGKEEQHKIEIN